MENRVTAFILDLVKLISKKITVDDFLELHPEYYGPNGELGKNLFPKIDMLLKTRAVTNADKFAELVMKFISLTNDSYTLLDKFIGISLTAVKSLNEHSIDDDVKITKILSFNDRARNVVPGGGIEPPTRGFSILCSTD